MGKESIFARPRYRISASRYGDEFYDWTFADNEESAMIHAEKVEKAGFFARVQKRRGTVYTKILYQTEAKK